MTKRSVECCWQEIRGYVEYTISELKGLGRTLDDDEMGDDDVFEAPADENMIFTKQAEIDNFHIKKAWQNRLPEFLKFCQKQIARSFPQVGVIRIRVREPNKDPVEKADFQRVILAWNGMPAKQIAGMTVMSYFALGFDKSGAVGDNAYMRSTAELTRRMIRL
ncbi:hypothetical protein Pmar_PMAR005989 [Perkinsus marinus ATCC 50983]|uniref:Uncharacterized protein n=1 Tax=Perkinsus marinus (strain ATCC 50983 / TXsc) TaxID=423536 RepID=C5L9X0_PERM5|nr:hypothetical protein Pmar_PMAR005989 [Perkinsus marinus ATCC 50983]EER06226.1 hypothetical protein Pmar_PMAR005989 [Perkinsus marinus ATCC 50983]|eukprot:XP_002774410.1 hypothetical protein Pmar_PMAR005989 [Perkinsus marinus ATCC 50983]